MGVGGHATETLLSAPRQIMENQLRCTGISINTTGDVIKRGNTVQNICLQIAFFPQN